MKPDWPQPGSDAERLELFKAELTECAALRARFDRPEPQDDRIDEHFVAAYYELLASRIGQSRSTAETLQRAAAAIATFYGAALGVAFSVGDHPLPARAVLPLTFVGLAIVTSTVYLAWQGARRQGLLSTVHPELETDPFQRSRGFMIDFQVLVKDFITRRDSWLRAAVVSLAFGLVLVPIPFIDIDTRDAPAPSSEVATGDELEPAWPEFDSTEPVRVEDRALRALLYDAQVAEVARQREAELARLGTAASDPALRIAWLPETGWAILGLVLCTVVLGVALWPKLPRPRRSGPS